MEVLDESCSKVFSLLFPLCRICISVARIKDTGVYTLEFGRNYEVEIRDSLGRSLIDRVVEDSVDDSAGVTDGDTLASSVPACVNEVSLGTGLLHLLDELFCVLGRMEFEERLAEASGEGRSRLGDSALSSCEFCSEAGEEVVLCLLRVQDGNRRKYAECVSGEEDNLLCSGTLGLRTDDLLNMVDRIRNAGILGHALVVEVNLASFVNSNILEECIAADCIVDVRFGLLVELDDLCIAAAFEVEDALVVPTMLIVTDKKTLRIS